MTEVYFSADVYTCLQNGVLLHDASSRLRSLSLPTTETEYLSVDGGDSDLSLAFHDPMKSLSQMTMTAELPACVLSG